MPLSILGNEVWFHLLLSGAEHVQPELGVLTRSTPTAVPARGPAPVPAKGAGTGRVRLPRVFLKALVSGEGWRRPAAVWHRVGVRLDGQFYS